MRASLNLIPNAVGQSRPNVLYGQVSSAKPAPSSFTDPLYVVFPQWHADYFWTVHNWPACHGTALPARGATVMFAKDDQRSYRCVWWDGTTSNPSSLPPSGPAGGVLSGTYPNPGFASLQTVQAFSYSNSWRDYSGGSVYSTANGYWKDPYGVVQLQGLVDKNGGSWVPSETIVTLPSGYRPTQDLIFSAAAAGSGPAYAIVEVRVNTDGTLQLGPYGAPANPVVYLSLSEVRFRTS